MYPDEITCSVTSPSLIGGLGYSGPVDVNINASAHNVHAGSLFASSLTTPTIELCCAPESSSTFDVVRSSQTATTGGRKFDGGKLQYGLVPPNALEAMVEILTFGAEKYEPDNWKRVPDAKRRYFDALNRHLWAWKKGEQDDPETGKNHLAHALCCLMFLFEHDIIDFSNNEDVK